MAEDIGTGGRAGYYEGAGAARHVIQNHLLQHLALTAMEEPSPFNADDLRAEKEKILAAVRPPEARSALPAHGQFARGR
jgi:glucose-6-phosphate 1-dehydrogenase